MAILGKSFISCLISSNSRNLHLLRFKKINTFVDFKKLVTVKRRLREVVMWGILIPYFIVICADKILQWPEQV